jgi:DNA-binding GntR family transcriptional regulator
MALTPKRPSAGRNARVVTRTGDTADEAYARLRDLIIEGVYLPGQRLPQAKLMEVLRLGRTPLRNALSRLQNDGLVIATPNHGFAAAPVPVASAEEIYTLRLVVEPPLLEALAPNVDEAQLERMRELLRRMEDCLDEPAAFQRAHREYHMVERATFASPFIDELVLNMYRHLYRHQRARLVRERTPIDFLRLDRETVDALSAGDWLRARRALEFHLIDAAISFLAQADVTHYPVMIVSVARANGIIVEAFEDGRVPVPATIRWVTPCRTLPPLRTAHLVYEPEEGGGRRT